MNRLFRDLDPKYVKICTYASLTVIITTIIMLLLYLTGGFWKTLWSLFTAVLRPVLIGGIFSYLLSPMVGWIEGVLAKKKKTSWARILAVIISFLIVLGAVGLIVFLIAATMYKSAASLDISVIIEFFRDTQESFTDLIEMIESALSESGLSVSTISSIVSAVMNGVKNFATGLLFGIIFSIYFLLDNGSIAAYWKRALRLTAGDKADDGLEELFTDADRVFSGYLRGQFLDAAVVGTVSSIVLLLAGIPSAVMVGVLTGLGNLIPYIGPVVGFITLIIVCLPTAAWGKLVTGVICLALVMFIDSNVINPKLLSSSIKIHPLLVVAALIGGGAIGGFLGMIVAVPTAALLKIQFDRYLDKREKEKDAVKAE